MWFELLEYWRYFYIFCHIFSFYIGLKTAKLVYARNSTTTLGALNSILFFKKKGQGQYPCVCINHSQWTTIGALNSILLSTIVIGSQVYQPCFNFLSPYKGWSWTQDPSIGNSRYPQIILKRKLGYTTRMYLFYHWEQWRTLWGVHQR